MSYQRQSLGSQETAQWIDITSPSYEDLENLAKEFNIDPVILLASLKPDHLPKFEKTESSQFLILRLYDEEASEEADTTQELTRKISLFRKGKTLITIHRSPLKMVEEVYHKWEKRKIEEKDVSAIFYDLFSGVLKSFEKPVEEALSQLEDLEMGIFGAAGAKPFELHAGYLLKRKSFVFKRLVYAMVEIVNHAEMLDFPSKAKRNKIRDQHVNLFYYCEELAESINSLLNLQISLASQKTNESAQQTNEVIRVLTIFSMFLLPLNVVTGIYGMNFEHIPELKWPFGYAFALGLMLFTVIILYLWFHSKGWLKRRR